MMVTRNGVVDYPWGEGWPVCSPCWPIQRLELDAAVYRYLLLGSREGQTMKATAPAAIAIAALLFSGCSVSQVINTGGDTKCKDFTTQDEKKQNDEVSNCRGQAGAGALRIWRSPRSTRSPWG